ncbi:MAG: uroporphyrinogen decarboxylase family protein [Candidatus Helarchaeota archaeon]
MDAPTRVLMAINHEEPDRVPAFESAFTNNTIMRHYGIKPSAGLFAGLKILRFIPFRHSIMRSALKNRKLVAKGLKEIFEFSRRVKLDIGISVASLFPRKIIKNGFIDEYGRIMKLEKYSGDGTIILGYYGGFFKDFDDYESWEQLDPNDEIRIINFLAGQDLENEMKHEVFNVPAVGALMECTWEGFGLENFSRLLAHRKQIKKVFDDRGEFTLEMVKILAENGARLIILWDDYGFKNGLFMSPKNYRQYVFPWIKRICEAAHKNDSKILLHSDGDLMQIFEDIVSSGVDALNPIEPTTANPDYNIFKLHEKYGDKLTFVGNISPVMLSQGKISEIEEYSKKLIKVLAPGGGYIFSSGHSINPAVTIDRWEAVMRIREKYGNYPIKIDE